MQRDFEYTTYTDDERLAILENRTAELLRRLEQVTPAGGEPEYQAGDPSPVEVPSAARAHTTSGYADSGRGHPPDPTDARRGGGSRYRGSRVADRPRARTAAHPQAPVGGYPQQAEIGYADPAEPFARAPAQENGEARTAGYPNPLADGYPDEPEAVYDQDADEGYPSAGTGGYPAAPGGAGRPGGTGDRTEGLINRGRGHARRGRRRWRLIAIAGGAVAALAALIAIVVPGGGGSWPASVATVQAEITTACQNPNVVSEPSEVNFACAKATQQILWVFALLTSYDNPSYSDASNGRKGLEPIAAAQGGNIAWSLNLHHPYNPASPIDSLEVAARAINNIIGGASVTGSNGKPEVQPGLESTAANCAMYTGSPALITRQGFPPICALPVNTPDGEAALVTDVFKEWMVGAPAQYAIEAGVLFENADNPGDPRVQSILSTLRTSGL